MKFRLGCWRSASSLSPKPIASGSCFSVGSDGEATASPLNNEVAGFKFAVVGVFYAVLLAFVVVAVWEDYRETETAVRNEAKALADLH